MTVLRRAAVLGKPIAHSLSPVIHNAGYAAAGLPNWSYTAIECAEAEFLGLIAGLGPEWAGLSLTMPLKEVALSVADELSPIVARVGAANTLVRRAHGTWYADNTDITGMVYVLREAQVAPSPTVTLLGAGGSARGALAAAAELSARAVTVVARRAEAIDDLRPVAEALGLGFSAASWAEAGDYIGADVVISTVPKGVADPLAAHVPWRKSTIVFDVIYDPWPTPLAAAAAAAGCTVISGLDLLLAQAVGQFEQFTGVLPAPVQAMQEALVAARAPA